MLNQPFVSQCHQLSSLRILDIAMCNHHITFLVLHFSIDGKLTGTSTTVFGSLSAPQGSTFKLQLKILE